MSLRDRRFYGFLHGRGKSLRRIATSLEKRLGVTLERRNNSHIGEYFTWGGDTEGEASLRVCNNIDVDSGDAYFWMFADYDPIIEVCCRSEREHDEYSRRVLTVPGVEYAWQYGDRRRMFGSDSNEDRVSFVLEIEDRAVGFEDSILVRRVKYSELMRTLKLGMGRELIGAVEITAKQVDGLKAGIRRKKFRDRALRYTVNLNSIKFDKITAP
ncbi:MAG: hypothetical protein K8S25_01420 [Alphaproteobacteria bacterium]|nr:hypothetical protein [Alphaproteobacteria bacterium]